MVHDGACCSHLGDTLQLDMKVLESVSDRWHLAYPEACRFRLGGEHKFFQLYLVPHNNPLFAQGLEKVRCFRPQGMNSGCFQTVAACNHSITVMLFWQKNPVAVTDPMAASNLHDQRCCNS